MAQKSKFKQTNRTQSKPAKPILNGQRQKIDPETPINDLLPEKVLKKLFRFTKYQVAKDLHLASDKELLALPGIGPSRLAKVRVTFGPPPPEKDEAE